MSRTHGTKDFWLTSLRSDGTAFLNAISQPDVISVTVPSCPDWTVGELARHLGAIYRRVRVNAASSDIHTPWPALAVPDDAPAADDPSVVSWFGQELAQIDAFLQALDPDRPVWNWAPQAKVGAFWHRRLAHETAVHRWDAQLATGLPEPLDSKLAGDTVSEVFDTMLPAGRRRSPSTASGMVHLVASDLDQHWWVRVRGEGVALLDTNTLLDDSEHQPGAVASGTASDLALALWGRVSFDVLHTTGDLALLEALRL